MSVRAAHPGAALRVYTFAEARGPRRLSGRWRELGAWRWGGRDNWERTLPGVTEPPARDIPPGMWRRASP